jgi:hypothetical protein
MYSVPVSFEFSGQPPVFHVGAAATAVAAGEDEARLGRPFQHARDSGDQLAHAFAFDKTTGEEHKRRYGFATLIYRRKRRRVIFDAVADDPHTALHRRAVFREQFTLALRKGDDAVS